jgi:hypothetical protein
VNFFGLWQNRTLVIPLFRELNWGMDGQKLPTKFIHPIHQKSRGKRVALSFEFFIWFWVKKVQLVKNSKNFRERGGERRGLKGYKAGLGRGGQVRVLCIWHLTRAPRANKPTGIKLFSKPGVFPLHYCVMIRLLGLNIELYSLSYLTDFPFPFDFPFPTGIWADVIKSKLNSIGKDYNIFNGNKSRRLALYKITFLKQQCH